MTHPLNTLPKDVADLRRELTDAQDAHAELLAVVLAMLGLDRLEDFDGIEIVSAEYDEALPEVHPDSYPDDAVDLDAVDLNVPGAEATPTPADVFDPVNDEEGKALVAEIHDRKAKTTRSRAKATPAEDDADTLPLDA